MKQKSIYVIETFIKYKIFNKIGFLMIS